MKRITSFILCLFMLFALLFISCKEVNSDPNPDNDIDIGSWFTDDSPGNGTYVKFINNNAFSVNIYSDYSRYTMIAEVPAGGQSDYISTSPNKDGAQFYPTYQIVMEDLKLPYEGNGIIARVDENKTTLVTIPSLKNISESSPDVQLTSNTYIKIQNNGSFSLVLRKNANEVLLEWTSSDSHPTSSILNGGETGLYKISPGSVSDYSLRKNTTEAVTFPSAITQFSAASIYVFSLNEAGVLTYVSQSRLTLGEAGKITGNTDSGGGGGDGTEFSPIQLTSNAWANGEFFTSKSIIWYSFGVTSGTTYYVWWNDKYKGNSTKTADVYVDAAYSGGSSVFSNVDSGWDTPQSFKASSNGTVKLKVYGNSIGTFGIVYSNSSTRPGVPVTYTVTFNSNSGSGTTPSSLSGFSGTNVTLPSGSGLSRSGYVFGGWNTSSAGTGTNYAAGSNYYISGNITLYAKWNTEVTVTFDANNGSGNVPSAQTANSGTTITLPTGNEISRAGYKFDGWNTSSAGTGTNYNAGSIYTLPTSSITLYAKWNPEYTVTFDANDGQGSVLPSQKAYSGASITLPTVTDITAGSITKYGFTFGGWSTTISGTGGTNYDSGASYSVTGNITLYARWTTKDLSSSSPLLLTENVWVDGNIIGSDAANYKFDVTTGTDYYVWWNDSKQGNSTKTMDIAVVAVYMDESTTSVFTSQDSGYNSSQTFKASKDGTVRLRVTNFGSTNSTGTYAIVYSTANTRPTIPVTVKFDANGGSGAPSDRIADATSTIKLPNGDGLIRASYVFGGWNTNSNGTGTNYAAGVDYTVPSTNTTLYAKWNAVYTVTFNANGGSGPVPPAQTVTGSITLPSGAGLVRAGYVFGGWNNSAAGTGTTYNPGQTYTVSVNITLYAKWNPVYTVKFSANGGSGAPSEQTTSAGSSITLPSGDGLSKNGYTFGGWNTKADGTGSNYATGVSYTVSDNVTLYALWYTSSTQSNPISLNWKEWTDGNINSTISNSVWYSFEVVTGSTYYIWWNDKNQGNNTKTADVEVNAYYNDGSLIFEDKDSAYTTPQSFIATSSGTVKLKVLTYGTSGTFAICFNNSNTRP